MEKQQKWLLRQFHTLCSRLRLSAEEKAAIIEGYGVESSADINNDDLMNICRALEKRLDSNAVKLDRLRKQVIADAGQAGEHRRHQSDCVSGHEVRQLQPHSSRTAAQCLQRLSQ